MALLIICAFALVAAAIIFGMVWGIWEGLTHEPNEWEIEE